MMVLFNADEGYIKVTMMNDSIRGGDGVITPKGGWCKNWAKTPEELVAVLDANNVDVYEDNLYHSSDVDDANDYGFTFVWEAHDIINEALAIIDKRLMKCEAIPLVDRAEIVHGGIGNSKVRRPDNKYAYYRDERVDRVNKRKGYDKLADDHVYRSHAGGVAAAIRDDMARDEEFQAQGARGAKECDYEDVEFEQGQISSWCDEQEPLCTSDDTWEDYTARLVESYEVTTGLDLGYERTEAQVDAEYAKYKASNRKPAVQELRDNRDKNIADMLRAKEKELKAGIKPIAGLEDDATVDHEYQQEAAAEGIAAAIERQSWTCSSRTDEQLEKDLEALSQ